MNPRKSVITTIEYFDSEGNFLHKFTRESTYRTDLGLKRTRKAHEYFVKWRITYGLLGADTIKVTSPFMDKNVTSIHKIPYTAYRDIKVMYNSP